MNMRVPSKYSKVLFSIYIFSSEFVIRRRVSLERLESSQMTYITSKVLLPFSRKQSINLIKNVCFFFF